MMGRKSGQIGMLIIDMEEMIPSGHLLRKIDAMISFDFFYEIPAPYYRSYYESEPEYASYIKCTFYGIEAPDFDVASEDEILSLFSIWGGEQFV